VLAPSPNPIREILSPGLKTRAIYSARLHFAGASLRRASTEFHKRLSY
jgi:hypothetical protein